MIAKIVVCGAGGYVGSRLVKHLVESGHENIRAVYSRVPTVKPHGPVQWCWANLRERECCAEVVEGARWVFNLAASVGGIGFVTSETSKCLTNVLINTHLVEEAAKAGVSQYFFASSSCVYPSGIDAPLRECDAYPGNPMGGYGWEKLFSERVCLSFAEERNLPVCIARYHGIYGPGDVRAAGKDHVATALAKKVIQAKLSGVHEISIWGNGEQTRSLLYIDDCVEGTLRQMERGVRGPINLAHPNPVSVNQIVDVLEEIAGIKLTRFYQPNAPTGRKHKVSDNLRLREALNWQPETSLVDGMSRLYNELWDAAMK